MEMMLGLVKGLVLESGVGVLDGDGDDDGGWG